MRKPRLPPARSLEITECKPHGQHSYRYMDTIQKPAMTLSCGIWEVEIETSETWCENGSKVKRQRNYRRSGATQSPLTCALSSVDDFFFGRRPLPFGGSPLEAYSRTSGESNHHRQSVSDTRVPPYQLSHEDTLLCLALMRVRGSSNRAFCACNCPKCN